MGVNLCDDDAYRRMSRANTELKVLNTHTTGGVFQNFKFCVRARHSAVGVIVTQIDPQNSESPLLVDQDICIYEQDTKDRDPI